jgi:hypothetical protein
MRGGGFGYSNSMRRGTAGVLERLGCPSGNKVVAALLSSYDELLAADLAGFGWSTHNGVFSSQIEWVKWLFAFARSRPDIHLVVRVHPREFAINAKASDRAFHLRRGARTSRTMPDQPPDEDLRLPRRSMLRWSLGRHGMDAGTLGVPVTTTRGCVVPALIDLYQQPQNRA